MWGSYLVLGIKGGNVAKKKAPKRPSRRKAQSDSKEAYPKPSTQDAVIHILHENVAGYRCPVCLDTVLFMDEVTPCKHVLGIELDIAGEAFFKRKKTPKGSRPVTFAVADAGGPHGGTMTLVFDMQGIKGDPKELYWEANKDQKEFQEALARSDERAKDEVARERARAKDDNEASILVRTLYAAASAEGYYKEPGQALDVDKAVGHPDLLSTVTELIELIESRRAERISRTFGTAKCTVLPSENVLREFASKLAARTGGAGRTAAQITERPSEPESPQ